MLRGSTDISLVQLLETGLTPLEAKVAAHLVRELIGAYRAWPVAPILDERPGWGLYRHGLAFLEAHIEDQNRAIAALKREHASFETAHLASGSEGARRQRILDFARELGASARDLKEDELAFGRYFDHEAVVDRYHLALHDRERRLSFALGRLGHVVAAALGDPRVAVDQLSFWRLVALEDLVRPILTHDGDSRVRVAAFRCLCTAVCALASDLRERSMKDSTVQFVYRAALDRRSDTWIQCEALGLLANLSTPSLCAVLKTRLLGPAAGDDLFVRRRAVRILGETLAVAPIEHLVSAVASDPSPFVRQALARALTMTSLATVREWLPRLAVHDDAREVRACALLESLALVHRPDLRRDLLALLVSALGGESDELVLRVAIHAMQVGVALVAEEAPECLEEWKTSALTQLAALHVRASQVTVRRWAAQAHERIWCTLDPVARRVESGLSSFLVDVPPGSPVRLPRALLDGVDDEHAGRVLSVISQKDFGFDLSRSWLGSRIVRGPRLGFRFWRFLHEVLRPSPDKREAFCHTTGRIFGGTLRAPSAILSELSATRVPGEPLFIPEEGGWRPYVPLVDEALSALDCGLVPRPIFIHTSEGVTRLRAPLSGFKRLLARARLTAGFVRYGALRNWREGSSEHPAAYLRSLRDLGFEISFHPHSPGPNSMLTEDPLVRRFFPAVLPVS
ncbi:MAG: HEAT repeat domain-containing protein, partial [Candidatus Riflebacteria bacterium]|nr:HEAT repeat domain-containing protein [Candidatus Riflebacteria bacterium]